MSDDHWCTEPFSGKPCNRSKLVKDWLESPSTHLVFTEQLEANQRAAAACLDHMRKLYLEARAEADKLREQLEKLKELKGGG